MNWLAFLGIVTLGNIYMIYKICHRMSIYENSLIDISGQIVKVLTFLDKENK